MKNIWLEAGSIKIIGIDFDATFSFLEQTSQDTAFWSVYQDYDIIRIPENETALLCEHISWLSTTTPWRYGLLRKECHKSRYW